ncbi:Lipase (class 2) [Paenibacillus sp. UNCCL117]|nr:Lipase (class 2) [Paenibacillus sp. cl123]SFW65002.1 Lipase (class 2) [Paenibacillus sp. UNCCL117]
MKRKMQFMMLFSMLALLLAITCAWSPMTNTAEAATARVPVVFVHGLTGSDTNFDSIKSYLLGQGWSEDELYAIDLPSKSGHQELNSAALASFVDPANRTLESPYGRA